METLNVDLLKSIPIPADIREGALALEGRVNKLIDIPIGLTKEVKHDAK